MGAFFMPDRRWVVMTYTPPLKGQKIPDAVLSTLATIGHAEVVGPRVIQYHYRSDEKVIAALGSSAEVDEYVTVTLAGGEHEEVHDDQRAKHDPVVAEVRQPDGRTRLIYTRHVFIWPLPPIPCKTTPRGRYPLAFSSPNVCGLFIFLPGPLRSCHRASG